MVVSVSGVSRFSLPPPFCEKEHKVRSVIMALPDITHNGADRSEGMLPDRLLKQVASSLMQ